MNPGFLSPEVKELLVKNGVDLNKVHGFEVLDGHNIWIVDVKNEGSYVVDTDNKKVIGTNKGFIN